MGLPARREGKSLETLIRLLVGAAGRDGNLLLNVGPQPDGEIDAAQGHEIGAWLKQNGASIYGTRGRPWLSAGYGVSTHSGSTVFVHLLRAPEANLLVLPTLPSKVLAVTGMDGAKLPFTQTAESLRIDVPLAPDR